MGYKPLIKLTNEELIQKSHTLINKLFHDNILSQNELNLLNIIINKYEWSINEVEHTTIWAKEAFKENERLIELIKERWEAGWKGEY